MTGLFGSIFLGGCGFMLGIMIGKSIVKDGQKDTTPGLVIALSTGVFFMCGFIWIGLLNGWV